jgi:hypothetical protein
VGVDVEHDNTEDTKNERANALREVAFLQRVFFTAGMPKGSLVEVGKKNVS